MLKVDNKSSVYHKQEKTLMIIPIPVLDVFLVQSHHFFEVCDVASAADLPQSGDARFDGQSCIMMQLIQVGF